MSSHSEYVSRVVQIDALTLDAEFYSLIRNQILSLLNQLKIGHWSLKYGPELNLAIKFLIWKLSVFRKECTVGQSLLGVKYPFGSGNKLKLLFALDALLPYAYDRLCASFRSNEVFRKFQKPLLWSESLIKLCEVTNFCVFLMQNRYPSLVNRIVQLRFIPAYQNIHPSIGYSYQIRELLWHQFADLLMMLLPLINFHRLKRYLKGWGISNFRRSGSTPFPTRDEIGITCCICNQDAIIPQKIDFCTFCYYCIKANLMADPGFACSDCPHNT